MRAIFTRFRAWLACARGGAALEFALIMPFMAALSLGVMEINWRVSAAHLTGRVASDTADLTARMDSLTTAQLNDVRTLAEEILGPSRAGNVVGVDIASLGYDGANPTPRVLWRRTFGPASTLTLADFNGLARAGESIIWVGVRYDYAPPIAFVLPETAVIERIAVARPRLTRRIALDGRMEIS